MKTRTIAMTMALCFVAAAVCFASDVNMGTWKLNEAKSKFAPGATKNQKVVYDAAGDQVKVALDGMTADGKSLHIEWTGKYDGKFYPLTGDAGLTNGRTSRLMRTQWRSPARKVARSLVPVALSWRPMAKAVPSPRPGLTRRAKRSRPLRSTTKSRDFCRGLA